MPMKCSFCGKRDGTVTLHYEGGHAGHAADYDGCTACATEFVMAVQEHAMILRHLDIPSAPAPEWKRYKYRGGFLRCRAINGDGTDGDVVFIKPGTTYGPMLEANVYDALFDKHGSLKYPYIGASWAGTKTTAIREPEEIVPLFMSTFAFTTLFEEVGELPDAAVTIPPDVAAAVEEDIKERFPDPHSDECREAFGRGLRGEAWPGGQSASKPLPYHPKAKADDAPSLPDGVDWDALRSFLENGAIQKAIGYPSPIGDLMFNLARALLELREEQKALAVGLDENTVPFVKSNQERIDMLQRIVGNNWESTVRKGDKLKLMMPSGWELEMTVKEVER